MYFDKQKAYDVTLSIVTEFVQIKKLPINEFGANSISEFVDTLYKNLASVEILNNQQLQLFGDYVLPLAEKAIPISLETLNKDSAVLASEFIQTLYKRFLEIINSASAS